MTKFKSYN